MNKETKMIVLQGKALEMKNKGREIIALGFQDNVFLFKKPDYIETLLFIDKIYQEKEFHFVVLSFLELLYIGEEIRKISDYLQSFPFIANIMLNMLCANMGLGIEFKVNIF